jgi:hypothetical protein
VNFQGTTRRNDTHQSTTDPDARLYKKAVGRESKLGYLAHLLTENRHGLIIDTAVTTAGGTAERDAAPVMLGELPLTTRRITVAADKAYDTRAWVAAVRRMRIHAARGPERIRVRRQRDRRAHDPTRRLSAQPSQAEAH